MLFWCGTTYVFEPLGWLLNLVVKAIQSEQMGHDLAFTVMLLKRGEGCFLRAGGTCLSFWLAFEPCSIGVSKRANGPRPSCPSRSLQSFTAMPLKRGEGCFFPSWRLLLAFFFDRSEADLMPSDRAAARSLPSFTGRQFRS